MKITGIMRSFMIEHTRSVEMFQWSIMSSMASLIYSEYIKCINSKINPIHVPSIKSVRNILSIDGILLTKLKNEFIDKILDNELVKKCNLDILNDENINYFRDIFNEYILSNVSVHIPKTIAKKFDLESDQRFVIEDSHIDLFRRISLDDSMVIDYLVDETALGIVSLNSDIQKNRSTFNDIKEPITFSHDEFITIGNDNAIAPIHINHKILSYDKILAILNFVSLSEITVNENYYTLTTHKENSVTVSKPIFE